MQELNEDRSIIEFLVPLCVNNLLQVPESLLNSLLSCSLVEKLAATPGLDLATIVSTNPQTLTRILTDRPEILDCIPTNILSLLAITPAIINNIPSSLLINLVRRIPDSELEDLLSNSTLLLQLPPDSLVSVIKADPRLLTRLLPLLSDSTILALISVHPLLLNLLPASILATLARTRPWLLGRIPHPLVVTIAKRQEIFGLLTDQDLTNILAFQPSLLWWVPQPTLVHLLQCRPHLLHSLPPSVEPVLVQLLQSENFLSLLPTSLVAKLATMPIVLRNLDKSSFLQAGIYIFQSMSGTKICCGKNMLFFNVKDIAEF